MSELAKKRWKLLAGILSNRRCEVSDGLLSASVRRFSTFNLIKKETLAVVDRSAENQLACDEVQDGSCQCSWYRYTCELFSEYSTLIRHLDDSINIPDLIGFNQTGNVCVWPSEEILTYYTLQHRYLFKGTSVCELGGGMTCLAGLSVAVCSEANHVLLTDGNKQSVSNVGEIIDRNKGQLKANLTEARLLRWNEENGDLAAQFDWILCADCLFFDEFRQDLLKTMTQLLKTGGQALIFAPSRGDTFDKFASLVSSSKDFTVLRNTTQYDDHVWNLHLKNLSRGVEIYDESLHFPRLLQLRKENSDGRPN